MNETFSGVCSICTEFSDNPVTGTKQECVTLLRKHFDSKHHYQAALCQWPPETVFVNTDGSIVYVGCDEQDWFELGPSVNRSVGAGG